MTFRSTLFILATLLGATLVPNPVEASGSLKRLTDGIFPQVGQRDTEVAVTLRSNDLHHPTSILTYQEGITLVGFEPVVGKVVDVLNGGGRTRAFKPGARWTLRLAIAADAALGEHKFRVVGEEGMGVMETFWVTPFPVVEESMGALADNDKSGRNDTPETAQEVPINCSIAGYTPWGAPQDDDHYRVARKTGERLTIQICSARLGSFVFGGMTDIKLDLYAPNGKRVARSDDTDLFAQDPYVSIICQQSGDYVFRLSQQMDFENSLRHYIAHIGDFERPKLTYPLGGQAGTELTLALPLADGAHSEQTVKLPAEVGPFEQSLVPLTALEGFKGTTDLPSPNLVRVASFPNVMEAPGDHGKPESPQAIDQALPLAINGRIASEGEVDWYRFTAKAGQRYRVRTYAMTLGSPLDATLWIRPAEGNDSRIDIEQDDSYWPDHDWEGHHYREQVKDRLDPICMFEPDKDGDYLIGIADARRLYGEDFVYRIEFQPHRDLCFAYFPSYPSLSPDVRDRVILSTGSTMARTIAIQNGFGGRYPGELTLEAHGLPEGVTFSCPTFKTSDANILATFTAAPGTKLGGHLIEFRPVPVGEHAGHDLGGGYIITTPATQRRGAFSMVFNKSRKCALAVIEEAPFDIAIKQPKVGLAQNGELELRVIATRKGDFKSAIYCEMDWVPRGVGKQPPMIIPEGETEAIYKLSASTQARPGTYQLSITARENEGGAPRTGNGFHYVGSPFVDVEVQQPYLSVQLERCALERGKKGAITGTIQHLRTFGGVADITLGRLPHGVRQAGKAVIQSGDPRVTIPIEATADALLGQYKEIYCEVAIPEAGQTVRQQTGNGTLRIDQERQ